MGQGHPSEKYGPSIGMMKFPIYGKIKHGNQTTNQNIISKQQPIPLMSSHRHAALLFSPKVGILVSNLSSLQGVTLRGRYLAAPRYPKVIYLI